MKAQKVFRVAIFGSPQAEQWLLHRAFADSRGRAWAYELAADPLSEPPHMCVVDPEAPGALFRWMASDKKGTIPAVFLGSVSQRAKFAVITTRPFTSGRIVDSLDQLARRIVAFSDRTFAARAARTDGLLRPVLV